jgi:SAM-dependent methyltransferase
MTQTRMYPVNIGIGNTDEYYGATADLLDARTRRRISNLIRLRGSNCLDLVSGGGSVALWLADKVGHHGHVLSTDFVARDLPQRRNLIFMVHDLRQGAPPGHGYDFIHARLVLAHLPAREHLVHRLSRQLGAGGVLLCEDWWMTPPQDLIIAAPSDGAAQLLRCTYAVYGIVLGKHGYALDWAIRVGDKMIDEGLQVSTRIPGARSDYQWRGGGPGARYLSACFAQSRSDLIVNGITAADLERVRNLLCNPLVVLRAHQLFSVSGRQPYRKGG